MLARNAEGLYWMGRYVERTGHLSRLLREQMETLVDRPVREINFGWRRIYGALRRRPSGPAIGFAGFDDDFTLADSFALADELTFERSNPDSVWSCFAAGRENARQIRQCITGEMWTSLNLPYLRLRELRIEDIWKAAPEGFYAGVSRDLDTFMGVVERTMYRDDRWRFLQIGRCTERLQLAVSLLLAQVDAVAKAEETSDHDWMSLLRVCHALDAYAHLYGVAIRPDRVFDLLVVDPRLPRSLYSAADAAARELVALAPGPGPIGEAASLAARMTRTVRGGWPSGEPALEARRDRFRQIESQCRDFHDLVMAAHVSYQIDAPSPSGRSTPKTDTE